MKKVAFLALALLSLCSARAGAAEIKNLRSTYGPFGGERPSNKVLPGDVLFFAFDVSGLDVEATAGLVKYTIELQVLNSKGKQIFRRKSSNQHYLTLGQGLISERAQVITGTDQEAGKYTVKLTVTDDRAKNPKPASASYVFELLPPDFGLIHAHSAAIAVPRQDFESHCVLVGWAKDGKKMPNVDVTLRILDEKGKPTLAKPFVTNIPKNLPEEVDVKDKNLLPLPFPITLNRPGRFTIEIVAVDNLGKKTARVSFPLLVLEPSVAVSGK